MGVVECFTFLDLGRSFGVLGPVGPHLCGSVGGRVCHDVQCWRVRVGTSDGLI